MRKVRLPCVADYENHFCEFMPKDILSYYNDGADEQLTVKDNLQSFKNIMILPRVLVDVSKVDTSTSILGFHCNSPLGLSPTACHRQVHLEGEIATSRAASKKNVIMILSSFSNIKMEDVAQACKENDCESILWFQMHFAKDREIVKSLVERAELSGFKALVITVDTPTHPDRIAVTKYKWQLPKDLEIANYSQYNYFKRTKNDAAELFDPTTTWKDIEWIISITKLPVILKGILSPQDALLAASVGVKGIIVSNHGGRQLDGVPSTLQMLPLIIKALKEIGCSIPIFMDGGVRKGSDVFKALALGASAVFLGRPTLWGLKYDGQNGVEQIISILEKELETTMKLTGCKCIHDIKPEYLLQKQN